MKCFNNHKDIVISDFENLVKEGISFKGANLRGANLRRADLRGANLRRADLRGANLDFSCLPLWCGSLNFKTDKNFLSQIKYHFESLCKYNNIVPEDVNSDDFHRVKSGELEKL